jgi:hypothetical protein
MLVQMILLPVFVLVGLTFAVLLGAGRRVAVAGGDTSLAQGPSAHLYILFYVLVAFAIPLRQADLVMVLLAWVFVVIELFQAGLLLRATETRGSSLFVAGALVLLAMWVYFALRILFPVW